MSFPAEIESRFTVAGDPPPTVVYRHLRESFGALVSSLDQAQLATTDIRGVRRLLLGSVAESTIRHSPCSVLVVHGDPAR